MDGTVMIHLLCTFHYCLLTHYKKHTSCCAYKARVQRLNLASSYMHMVFCNTFGCAVGCVRGDTLSLDVACVPAYLDSVWKKRFWFQASLEKLWGSDELNLSPSRLRQTSHSPAWLWFAQEVPVFSAALQVPFPIMIFFRRLDLFSLLSLHHLLCSEILIWQAVIKMQTHGGMSRKCFQSWVFRWAVAA